MIKLVFFPKNNNIELRKKTWLKEEPKFLSMVSQPHVLKTFWRTNLAKADVSMKSLTLEKVSGVEFLSMTLELAELIQCRGCLPKK